VQGEKAMKNSLVFTLISLMMPLSSSVLPSVAQSADRTDEKKFVVFMVCNDDLEGYCEGGQMKREEFIFGNDSRFVVGTFEDELILSGDYNVQGMLFDAEFSTLEDIVKTYDFTIKGLLIFDSIIFGLCDLEYSFITLNEEDTRCYFFGVSLDGVTITPRQ
jgi:hypothetical protein